MMTLEEAFKELNKINEDSDDPHSSTDLINGQYDKELYADLARAQRDIASGFRKHYKYKGYYIDKRGSGLGSYKIYGIDTKETFNLTNIDQVKAFINKLVAEKGQN